jgi:hypothetical protein
MQVNCRSNDIIWGAYGANAVHFSFLQEWLAWAIGVRVGVFYQVSFNYHIYEHHWPLMDLIPISDKAPYTNPFEPVSYIPLNQDGVDALKFLEEVENFVGNRDINVESDFLNAVVIPLIDIWDIHKQGENPMYAFEHVAECDWKQASMEWIKRAWDKKGELYVSE